MEGKLKKRILLAVAYDGTDYAGFQAQKSGVPTIEGELNRVLTELTGQPVEVIGASRTDAGVHAYCNLAVFDTESRIPPEKFAYAVNVRLPEQICVPLSMEVPEDSFLLRYDRVLLPDCRYQYVHLSCRYHVPEHHQTALVPHIL